MVTQKLSSITDNYANTQGFAAKITNHLPEAKTIVIGNVVPQYEEQVDLLKDKKEHTIIFVGRLARNHKRPHLLIEAFGLLAKKYPDWKVEIWGAKDRSAYYSQLTSKIKSLGLEDCILLKGTTKNIKEQLLRSDIFVIPSAYEGFGLAMTEAMSIGLPAVGYKEASAVNEIIHDGLNGFLCDSGVEDLSRKLDLLMGKPELRAKLGKQARVDMKQYSPDIIWKQWEDLMNSVVSSVK